METFSALLAICVWNSPVPGEFPAQRPVTRNCGGRIPDGIPHACPVLPVSTKAYIHTLTHFAKKDVFFQWETQILEIKTKGG